MKKIVSYSQKDTLNFGKKLGRELKPNDILCFHGDLGAGKTTLIKGIVAGAVGIEESEVNSPTFVYLNIYQGEKTVYHFDLYRLHQMDEFLSMGFDEYLFAHGICCIEWSEKIQAILPRHCYHFYLSYLDQHSRQIEWEEKHASI